jgi:hypothetical protein
MSEKLSNEVLQARLRLGPQPGTPWRHYKTGNLYWVQMCAIAEATQTVLVVYHQQDSAVLFARPLAEWTEVVEWEGQRIPRFARA